MTHARKLEILKDTFGDWLQYCDVSNIPIDQVEVDIEGTQYHSAYDATKARWDESRCILE
jgi:hypothetical protein